MSDITMCLHGCEMADHCYRWTAPQSRWQSMAEYKPDEDGKCDGFVSNKKVDIKCVC